MRFHFGPFNGQIIAHPALPYSIPLCRHVDDRHVPSDAFRLHVSADAAPQDAAGMRARMAGWTADLEPDEGRVYLHPEQPPDYRYFNELFAALGIGRTIQQGGFVLHASSFVAGGNAFLFAGLSGAGKSTIAAHLGRGHRISDDQSMLVPRAGGWWCQSAFHLEHEGAPPYRIFLIRQAPTTRLERLSAPRALPLVMRHLVLWQGDGKAHARVLDNLSAFLETVPCFKLDVGLSDIRLSHLFADVE